MSKHFAELTGPVTPKEAHEALSRFNASHWRANDHERARYSIPARPSHDDDIRLGAFIEHAERLVEAAQAVVDSFMAGAREPVPLNDLRAAIANLKEPAR